MARLCMYRLCIVTQFLPSVMNLHIFGYFAWHAKSEVRGPSPSPLRVHPFENLITWGIISPYNIAHVLAKRTVRKTFLVCTCYRIACVCKLRGREGERERDGSIQIIQHNPTEYNHTVFLFGFTPQGFDELSPDELTSQGYGRHLPPFSCPRKFSLKAGIIPSNFPPWLWDGWRVKPQSGPVIVGDHP